jgi:hypothetical protein
LYFLPGLASAFYWGFLHRQDCKHGLLAGLPLLDWKE